jgi:hypothetical protein
VNAASYGAYKMDVASNFLDDNGIAKGWTPGKRGREGSVENTA